jgi:chemotaxis protein methyltransferase CheR
LDITLEADLATRTALFELVRRHTGIIMNERKWPLLAGRLRRRLRVLALADYRDYLRVLEQRPEEVGDFIDLVTTNETSFFRTPRVWDYLERSFLPDWHRGAAGSVLRIWSAAASSGEEAYSMAMLCEEFRLRHPAFQYSILATDISDEILARAKQGVFQGRSLEGLRASHPALLERYFSPCADGYGANVQLRSRITFAKNNLHLPARNIGSIELALLRNVLIYFDVAGQELVLENVRRSMMPGGVLIVGESESLSRLDTGFAFEQPLVYRNRKESCDARP